MTISKIFKVIIPNIFRKIFKSKPKNKFESTVKSKWFGSEYGGFFVCQDILGKNDNIIVYSCGIGTDISFDRKILKQYKKSEILGFDPTPISLEWIKSQKNLINFNFYPIGISDFNGTEKMYFPKYHGVSYGIYNWSNDSKDEVLVDVKTIENIALENGHKYIDILKMDIEGSEFSVLNAINYDNIEFGQILVEFHERFLENGAELLKKTIDNLNKIGYQCFAISDDYEYSFINTKRFAI